jgi:hypothetical protein
MSERDFRVAFLVIGTMKGGTTSLANYLRYSPEIYMPRREVHFFDDEKNYFKGPGWYHQHFEPASEGAVIGEKTPAYAVHPLAPERIAAYNPDVRIVMTLRDPVARAYSHYWSLVNYGRETRTFFDAIADPEDRFGYVLCGHYADQIRRYFEHHDRRQFHFLLAEDLARDHVTTLSALLSFLGVANVPEIEAANVNRTYVLAHPWVQRIASTVFGNSALDKLVWRWNRRKRKEVPPLSDDMKRAVAARFEEANGELENLTGLDLSSWTGRGSGA